MDVNRALGAPEYALDAVDGAEREAVEAAIERDRSLASDVAALRSAATALAEIAAEPPPAGLRAKVLAAARERRTPGRAVQSPRRVSPVRVFRGQATDFAGVLASLPASVWDAMTVTGWTAHELAGHVLAIMRYVGSLFGVDVFDVPDGTEADHLAKTEPTVLDAASGPPEATVEAIRAAIDRLNTINDTRLDEPVVYDGLPVTIGQLLVIQTFELWTHGDDLLRAAGRPLSTPPAERLDLMSEMAVAGLVAAGMAAVGRAHPGKTAHVVLSGGGGGAWTVPLSVGEVPHTGTPDVTIVADVVDFCRVAARRLTPREIPYHADGDGDLVEDLLVGVQAFAA